MATNMGFNSTMVRLKEGFIIRNAIIKSKFQFHNGSIKREHQVSQLTGQLGFQFHNGSIKREWLTAKDDRRCEVSIPQWFD